MLNKSKWYQQGLVFVVATGLIFNGLSSALAQTKVAVKGTVFDVQNNETLPGVSVKIKGTSGGVITSPSGTYVISALNTDVLVFSALGYKPQEIKVGTRTTIDVRMDITVNSLKEVVVIGYGSVPKEDITGSVGTVDVVSIAKAPVEGFDQALAGRIAGVQVSSNEGQPGSEGINIVIRGNGSLTQDNSPLYVVDGFPIEDFDNGSLNTDDIESMTVLKDASATAIYGARGANGVIIIETKKGKVGAPVVVYIGTLGFQSITKRMDVMNPYDFVRYQIERTSTAKARYTPADLDSTATGYNPKGMKLEDYKRVKGSDWQDMLFRNGSANIHSLSVRGGNKDTRYAISGSLYDANAIIIATGSKRYQGRISLDQTFSKKISGGINANYSSRIAFGREASLANTAGSASSYLLYSTLGYRPVTGKYSINDPDDDEYIGGSDETDDLMDDEIDHLQDYRVNPIVSTKNEYSKSINNGLVTNAYLTYKIIPKLTLKVTGGINSLNRKSEYFFNSQTARGTPLLPSNVRGQWGSRSIYERIALSNENILTYKEKIDKNNSFDVMVGYSVQESRYESGAFTTMNVPNESLGIHGLGDGVPLSTSTRASIFKLQSFLGRANYNYKSKYLFTASFRSDGSSKFVGNNKWGYFPSGAFAWRMSREPFMKSLSFVSDAKLRLSYGLTGNNRVSDFAALPALDLSFPGGYSYDNGTPILGVEISSLGNKNLKWETTEQLNIGYDLSLLNNRVEFVFDIYRKKTKDLLLRAFMPLSTGFTSVYKNIGSIQNQGLEFTVNTVNVKNKKFSWQSSFNISFNENKILSLTEGQENLLNVVTWETAYNKQPLYISKIGQPAGQMYGYIWDGNYQYSDFDETSPGVFKLKNNVTTNDNDRNNITVKPGDTKYKDLNSDGVINNADLTVIGRGLPIHVGGFANDFTYKGFSLGVLLQWSYGNNVLNANRLMFEGGTRQSLNQFTSYNDRWTPENQSNTQYRIGGQGPAGVYSSRIVEDGSYLRLKTVAFGYSLPKSIYKKAKIKDISLTAAAQNLITWTKYSGFDPEVSSKHSVLTPGFDYSAYPHARTVVFGIKATL